MIAGATSSSAVAPSDPAASRRALAGLLGLGLAGAPLYVAAYRLGSMPYHPLAFTLLFAALCALHAAACWLVARRGAALPRRGALAVIGAVALAYRLLFVPAVPSLSDDFFRYVWDGHVQRQGYSPYRSPPAAPELAPLRDGYYWPKVNRKEQTSAYPPFAELVFAALFALRPFSTLVFKLAFLGLDLLTIALLVDLLRRRGASPLGAIVYAWHPLPVFEFLHSAHVDALAVTLLVAALALQARGREGAAGVALGLATLTKLYPGLLLPAFARRGRWRLPLACVATVAAGFAPALLRGDTNFRQFPTYLSEERYTSGERYFPLVLARLIAPVPAAVYVVAVALALIALSCSLYLRPGPAGGFDAPRRALRLATWIVLLVTPSYPWYYIWLLPGLALGGGPPRLPRSRGGGPPGDPPPDGTPRRSPAGPGGREGGLSPGGAGGSSPLLLGGGREAPAPFSPPGSGGPGEAAARAGLLYLTYAVALNYPGWWWLLPSLAPLAAIQYLPTYAALAYGWWKDRR